ncbi:hypothetical protein MAR_037875 [Mya arenaria]|uniref:Uncharacterized protein n=1 Tax=Mya arenaria TaxID=6604 RepID=A0ABY7FYL8_MYAAR|nr:hypothetical protein MAR_037875 [Mya arenaria]
MTLGNEDCLYLNVWTPSLNSTAGLPVTLFGHSSGATAIYALLASTLGRGLFHKAWVICGSPVMNKTAAEADDYVRNALLPFGVVVAETALKLYPENVQTPEFQLTSMVTDLRMTCGNEYLALVMATSFTSPVFRYIAGYATSIPTKAFGATFPARYAFDGIDMFAYYKTMGLMIDNMTDADRQWEVNVQQEVMSFVLTGIPFTADWGMFPGRTAENTTVTAGYHTAECLFWLKNGFFSYSWIK